MKKPKTKRGNLEPMTMTQFRAWLQGITDMQADDWCPNLEQWNTIRQRLDSVVDGAPVADTVQPATTHPHAPAAAWGGEQWYGQPQQQYTITGPSAEEILAANSSAVPSIPGVSTFA